MGEYETREAQEQEQELSILRELQEDERRKHKETIVTAVTEQMQAALGPSNAGWEGGSWECGPCHLAMKLDTYICSESYVGVEVRSRYGSRTLGTWQENVAAVDQARGAVRRLLMYAAQSFVAEAGQLQMGSQWLQMGLR